MATNYKKIIEYLKEYSGQQYKKQEKCKDAAEEKYMQDGAEKGREARQIFTDIANSIEEDNDLIAGKITQWQNSGTFVSYFWTQLKKQEYEDSNISISLFAEKAYGDYRIRLSVELAVEKSSDREKVQYRKLLDLPLDDGLVYVSGGNNDGKFEVLSERNNEIIKSANYKKVQVSYIFSNDMTEQEFEENLRTRVSSLLKYYHYVLDNDNHVINENEWLPSLVEYSPGITKEKWLELLANPEVFKTHNLLAMACMYDNGGSGSCTELGAKYHQSMTLWRTSCGVHLAERIANITGCQKLNENGKVVYFVIPFLYRKTSSDETGSYIYKLRPELYEALSEFDILRFLPDKESEEKLGSKETIGKIKEYIASNGFSYNDGLIENFYLSLKSKPFVILAGTSGTGKTRLVRLFAEAIGATSQNGRYKLVSVRPDWSDSSDLFGHVNLNDKFVPGEIIDFVKQAELDSKNSYFLCLDEMNLARVEYYLSDILSIIETREYVDGKVVTDPLINENYYGADTVARGKYGVVRIPDNLYIVGTVNMDETTFPFSRKVLDRANTIEFSTVELLADFGSAREEAKSIYADNSFMKADYVFFNQCAPDQNFVEEICIELQDINKILEKASAHVGYRVRDEIVFYMLNNKNAGNLLTRDRAFDNEIMQKILPRIQGSSASVKAMLCELFKHCAGDYESYQTESDEVSSKMMAAANKDTCKYKESAKKIAFMVRRFEEDGFTAYWL